MGVAQLYHHLAPRGEVIVVAKALIRLLRSHREVQSIVLNCIASMSTQRKVCFPWYETVAFSNPGKRIFCNYSSPSRLEATLVCMIFEKLALS